jgi:hypothetical protein
MLAMSLGLRKSLPASSIRKDFLASLIPLRLAGTFLCPAGRKGAGGLCRALLGCLMAWQAGISTLALLAGLLDKPPLPRIANFQQV